MGRCAEWKTTGSAWLFPVPWAFRSLLKFIDETYDSSKYPIYVTENGLSSRDEGYGTDFDPGTNGTDLEPNLNDQFRVDFYNEYIGQMLRAINEDDVTGECTPSNSELKTVFSRGIHCMVANGQLRVGQGLH